MFHDFQIANIEFFPFWKSQKIILHMRLCYEIYPLWVVGDKISKNHGILNNIIDSHFQVWRHENNFQVMNIYFWNEYIVLFVLVWHSPPGKINYFVTCSDNI